MIFLCHEEVMELIIVNIRIVMASDQVHADAWGCPMVPPPAHGPYPSFTQVSTGVRIVCVEI